MLSRAERNPPQDSESGKKAPLGVGAGAETDVDMTSAGADKAGPLEEQIDTASKRLPQASSRDCQELQINRAGDIRERASSRDREPTRGRREMKSISPPTKKVMFSNNLSTYFGVPPKSK